MEEFTYILITMKYNRIHGTILQDLKINNVQVLASMIEYVKLFSLQICLSELKDRFMSKAIIQSEPN